MIQFISLVGVISLVVEMVLTNDIIISLVVAMSTTNDILYH